MSRRKLTEYEKLKKEHDAFDKAYTAKVDAKSKIIKSSSHLRADSDPRPRTPLEQEVFEDTRRNISNRYNAKDNTMLKDTKMTHSADKIGRGAESPAIKAVITSSGKRGRSSELDAFTNPDPSYQEYVRSPKKHKTFNSNPDPNYVPYQRNIPTLSRSARLISKISESKVGQHIGEISSAVAKSPITQTAQKVMRNPLVKIAGKGLAVYGLISTGVEVLGMSGDKPARQLSESKQTVTTPEYGKPTPIKYVNRGGGVRDKRGVMMYPMVKGRTGGRNPYVSGTPELKNTVSTVGANASKVSKGGTTPKPLREQPQGLTGVDLGFLKPKLIIPKPRPMPRKEMYVP